MKPAPRIPVGSANKPFILVSPENERKQVPIPKNATRAATTFPRGVIGVRLLPSPRCALDKKECGEKGDKPVRVLLAHHIEPTMEPNFSGCPSFSRKNIIWNGQLLDKRDGTAK